MPKVTVIMPSLNVIKYIRPCMESVLSQTLSDIEILVIDAGSADGTLEALKEFAQKDKRVRIISSDKKSYGYQMNIGIKEASGEYVGIVETDDIIMPNMLEILYQKAIATGVDYVKGFAELFMEVSKQVQYTMPSGHVFEDGNMYDKILCPKTIPELMIRDIYLWTGIYRRDFIKQITLNETPGAAYQDAGFMLQAYTKAERAVYLPDIVYKYRQDNMGASSYDKRAFGFFVREYDYMQQFLIGLSEEWQEIYYVRMLNHCRRRFQVMGASGEFWQEALTDMEELRHRLESAVQQGILKEENLDENQHMDLNLFLDDLHTIYEKYAVLYRSKTENIHAMMKAIGKQKTVVFGSGRVGRFLHALIEYKSPGTILCYCDNQTDLWGTEIQGIKVLSPQKATEQYSDAVYLITGRKYETQMREQLGKLHIGADRQFTYTAGIDMLLFQI